MAKAPKKLNSMRLLETHGVDYTVYEFSDAIHNAEEVADAVGVPREIVFKTLVTLKGDGKPALVIVPAPGRLDLKAAAAALGEKKIGMAPHVEAERLTGLKVGGISPLALVQKHWPIVLDASAEAHPTILISAGQRGLNLGVPVPALRAILDPIVAAVAVMNGD